MNKVAEKDREPLPESDRSQARLKNKECCVPVKALHFGNRKSENLRNRFVKFLDSHYIPYMPYNKKEDFNSF